MAYFLGRDVKVGITTEDESNGIKAADATPILTAASSAVDGADAVEHLGASTIFDGTSFYNPFTDVTSVDLTLGSVDEDIAYMGQRTALKAEIKKETTIVITKKKTGPFFDLLFSDGRYGIKASNEVISIPNCVFAEKSTSLSADGVQEETLTFTGHVDPVFDASVPAGAMLNPTGATSL